MDLSKPSRARWLQIGLGVFTAGMAIGGLMLVYGHTGNRNERVAREAEGPTAPGRSLPSGTRM